MPPPAQMPQISSRHHSLLPDVPRLLPEQQLRGPAPQGGRGAASPRAARGPPQQQGRGGGRGRGIGPQLRGTQSGYTQEGPGTGLVRMPSGGVAAVPHAEAAPDVPSQPALWPLPPTFIPHLLAVSQPQLHIFGPQVGHFPEGGACCWTHSARTPACPSNALCVALATMGVLGFFNYRL